MLNYSLVLKFDKFNLLSPDKQTIINYITKKPFVVDYFGDELDNQADYIDEEIQAEFDSFSYINFFIHSISKQLDFDDKCNDDIIKELSEFINESKFFEVTQDGKDIDVYCR